MKYIITSFNVLSCILISCLIGSAQIPVNVSNFVQAETHKFFDLKASTGGFGKLVHNREVIQVDNQYIRRMNRDTRYSSGIFDLEEDLTIILPEIGERFMSMTLTDENHFIKKTIYNAGKYTITKDEIGSRYIQVTIRIFVDAQNKYDNDIVTGLQDAIIIEQASQGELQLLQWDPITREETRGHLLGLVKGIKSAKKMFGNEDEVDPILHLIGTAAGYGGLAPEHAIYLNVYPKDNDGIVSYVLEVPKDVPVDAFWSISVYNQKGYFQENKFNSYAYNNINAEKNRDGSISINLGGNPSQKNFIPISPGWSYNIRLYRPRVELLNGTWKFPEAKRVND